MEHRQLGRTGVRVSSLCLGMMNYKLDNEADATEGIKVALDAGINFFDTANVYSYGESETVTGRALKGVRDEVVIATKVYGPMRQGDVNALSNSRRAIKRECEDSLRRLDTDYIDLYQLHRSDPLTPYEETLQALDELVTEGKVHYVGVSTHAAWQTMEMIALADKLGLASAPVTEQPPYNILDRRVESELVPMALKHGVGLIPWSPLAAGLLTGKYSGNKVIPGTRSESMPELSKQPGWLPSLEAADKLAALATAHDLTPVQLSIGWLIHQPAVTAAIIGPRTTDHLRDYLSAADVTITDEIREKIDEIAPPRGALFPLSH